MSRRSLSWHESAACTGMSLDVFYPIGQGTRAASLEVARAKHVCERCAVVSECLASALDSAEPEGIWGGTTPFERATLRRQA